MKKYKGILILLNLIILLGLFNYAIFQKETLLTNGQLILLELAPVDPRSLLQGDYMELRYAISDNIDNDSIPKRGFCVVILEETGVARKVRIQKGKKPLTDYEYLIEYTSRDWRGINIGAESYFFQEGDAEKYENAIYGGLKVDGDGNSLLVGLYNKEHKKIE
jgi:uncharacterized membrane-anchored protein